MPQSILHPLSPTEWRLMSCVWDLRAATSSEVSTYLRNKDQDVPTKRIGIGLYRLETKGYLRSIPGPTSSRGRPPHIYFPLVTYKDGLQRQFQKFLADHGVDADDFDFLKSVLLKESPC